jgi:hypothetical protein
MAALSFTTQTNTVLGTLTNGMKVVSTVLAGAGVGEEAGTFTITPLEHIIAAVPAISVACAGIYTATALVVTLNAGNTVTMRAQTAGGMATANVVLLSFGY